VRARVHARACPCRPHQTVPPPRVHTPLASQAQPSCSVSCLLEPHPRLSSRAPSHQLNLLLPDAARLRRVRGVHQVLEIGLRPPCPQLSCTRRLRPHPGPHVRGHARLHAVARRPVHHHHRHPTASPPSSSPSPPPTQQHGQAPRLPREGEQPPTHLAQQLFQLGFGGERAAHPVLGPLLQAAGGLGRVRSCVSRRPHRAHRGAVESCARWSTGRFNAPARQWWRLQSSWCAPGSGARSAQNQAGQTPSRVPAGWGVLCMCMCVCRVRMRVRMRVRVRVRLHVRVQCAFMRVRVKSVHMRVCVCACTRESRMRKRMCSWMKEHTRACASASLCARARACAHVFKDERCAQQACATDLGGRVAAHARANTTIDAQMLRIMNRAGRVARANIPGMGAAKEQHHHQHYAAALLLLLLLAGSSASAWRGPAKITGDQPFIGW